MCAFVVVCTHVVCRRLHGRRKGREMRKIGQGGERKGKERKGEENIINNR